MLSDEEKASLTAIEAHIGEFLKKQDLSAGNYVTWRMAATGIGTAIAATLALVTMLIQMHSAQPHENAVSRAEFLATLKNIEFRLQQIEPKSSTALYAMPAVHVAWTDAVRDTVLDFGEDEENWQPRELRRGVGDMEWITTAWTWLQANGDGLWSIWASLIAVATAIVAYTPTKKDDSFISTLGSGAQGLRNVLVGRRPSDTRDQDPEAPVERKSKAK